MASVGIQVEAELEPYRLGAPFCLAPLVQTNFQHSVATTGFRAKAKSFQRSNDLLIAETNLSYWLLASCGY
jgi:hypothetical protein